jgi:hypothetical protein
MDYPQTCVYAAHFQMHTYMYDRTRPSTYVQAVVDKNTSAGDLQHLNLNLNLKPSSDCPGVQNKKEGREAGKCRRG